MLGQNQFAEPNWHVLAFPQFLICRSHTDLSWSCSNSPFCTIQRRARSQESMTHHAWGYQAPRISNIISEDVTFCIDLLN
jgi:hypothetical protein